MGFFFQGYTVVSVLTVLAVIAALVLLNEITRRSKILSILTYCVFPVVLVLLIATGVVGSPSSKTWFGVVKTYSALLGVVGFMAIRYTRLGNTRFAAFFPVAILGINIIEAIFRDLEVYKTFQTLTTDSAGLTLLGGPWNILNAIAGVLLVLTMTGWVGIRVSNTKSKDMVWADQLWFWIIAYDLWNLAYCYNCLSTRSMYAGVALLVSCTVAEFFVMRGIWLQHRAQTLALFGMFSLAVDYMALPAFGITSSYNPAALTVVSALALLSNLAVFAYEIIVIVKTKRNPLTQELYSNHKAFQRNLLANGLETPAK